MSEVSEIVMAIIALSSLIVAAGSLATLRAIRMLTEAHNKLQRKVGRLPCVKK